MILWSSMRVDPHGVGSVLHVIKRGARGADIVRDVRDKEHFLRSLYYLNDTHNVSDMRKFDALVVPRRPASWPERDPLVGLLAWTLMPNHFHLIVQEVREGGISKYMQRLAGSMSARFNARYGEKGSLFQGSYRGRAVESDEDLRWLGAYVMAKNVLELAEGGLDRSVKDFGTAWSASKSYRYSSLSIYAGNMESPLLPRPIDNPLLAAIGSPHLFRRNCEDMVNAFVQKRASDSAWE